MNELLIIKEIEEKLSTKLIELDDKNFIISNFNSFTLNSSKKIVAINLSESNVSLVLFLLKKINSLEKLILDSCQIIEIDFLESFPYLTHLSLKNNKITNLLPLQYCKGLNTIILPENLISDITILSQLDSLMQIDLYTNKISEITALSNLKYVTWLDLRENEIKNIQPLENLTNINQLNLYSNDIQDISTISKLKNLTHFTAGLNHIRDLGSLSELTELQYVNLRDNKISDIKPLEKLIKIKKLNLWDNKIENVDALSNLKLLSYLNLSENYIENIESLSNLNNLKILSLEGNKICDISKLKDLKKLEKLDLRSNLVKKLTLTLTQNLSEIAYINSWDYEGLNLYNNPLEFPPLEIIKQKKQGILNFFEELQKHKDTDSLNEVKMIVIGEDRAGKSSIVEALSNPAYQFHHKETTQGINIIEWKIDAKEIKELETSNSLKYKELNVNIWDFGGQEIYHATHQFFLTRHSVYLLVFEARRDIRHVDFYYWLNIIKVLSSNSPVFVILNKTDLPHKSLPIANYQETFPNIIKYIEVSCLNEYKHTIDFLRKEIKKLILNKELLPEMGIALPKIWVEIRKRIENWIQKGNFFMDLNQYIEICADYQMPDERALYLSKYFHQIGVFLHFQDNVHLNDTLFLNYQWLTNGIYKVLDDTEIIKNKGRFTNNDLIRIWNSNEYENKRSELLALMSHEHFNICFELSAGVFLAPQLLSEEAVDYQWNESSETLQFEFRYDFMPKGILTQLIAKSHKEISEGKFWRYGVLLEYENTQAIVIEYYFEKKIQIKVSGENSKDFLGIIRKYIKEINKKFKNLNISEMIPCHCKRCVQTKNPHFYDYSNLKERLKKGKTTIECYQSFENVNIYELLFAVGNQNTQMDDIVFLISKNELEKAINLLLSIVRNDDDLAYNQVILVSSRYNALKNNMIEGTLSEDEISQEKAQIRKSLLAIIKQYKIEN